VAGAAAPYGISIGADGPYFPLRPFTSVASVTIAAARVAPAAAQVAVPARERLLAVAPAARSQAGPAARALGACHPAWARTGRPARAAAAGRDRTATLTSASGVGAEAEVRCRRSTRRRLRLWCRTCPAPNPPARCQPPRQWSGDGGRVPVPARIEPVWVLRLPVRARVRWWCCHRKSWGSSRRWFVGSRDGRGPT
jgi:hypothetical protein